MLVNLKTLLIKDLYKKLEHITDDLEKAQAEIKKTNPTTGG